MPLDGLFSNSCSLFALSCWPLRQTSEPYSATKVTAATTTLRIKLTDRPPLLLLRLATRCRAPLIDARHSIFEVCPKAQFRVQPEAEPSCRFLLDRKRLFPDAKDGFPYSLKDFSASAEQQHFGLADFELNSIVEVPLYGVLREALKLCDAVFKLVALMTLTLKP
jgi:hypothetical protein